VTSSGSDVGADPTAADLQVALAAGDIEVHYQPNVDAAESQVVGFEALVRWDHHDHGPVSPARFVAVAERSDLILDLGSYVLRRACAEGVRLRRALPDRRLTISVNVSPRQLGSRRLLEDVRTVLDETGLDPDLLCLELTESALMDDIEQAVVRLNELRDLGVLLAIDDFGTGYSSLVHLKRFQADALKIDRTFVDTMTRNPHSMTLVSTIISLAHALDLKVIAEGVESEEQAKLLRLLKCDELQGYLFSKPLAPGEIQNFLMGGGTQADRRIA